MKAKRIGLGMLLGTEREDGQYVLATDYDALLELAMRLRAAWLHGTEPGDDTCAMERDSAWLEE